MIEGEFYKFEKNDIDENISKYFIIKIQMI